MNSNAPARVQQKQAVRELHRTVTREAYVDSILERDPEGGLGLDYPNRAQRRALRVDMPGPTVERQNRSDARPRRPRKARAKAIRAARMTRQAERRRAAKRGLEYR